MQPEMTVPAKNPVIAVVMPEATHAAIKRLAALQGRSKSAVVRDFLVETTPLLERIGGLLALAHKAQGKWPADVVAKLEALQNGLEGQALGAMDSMDMVLADGARAQSAAPVADPDPPMTNRGVKTPTKAKRVPTSPNRKGRK